MEQILKLLGIERGAGAIKTLLQVLQVLKAIISAVEHLQDQLNQPASPVRTATVPVSDELKQAEAELGAAEQSASQF